MCACSTARTTPAGDERKAAPVGTTEREAQLEQRNKELNEQLLRLQRLELQRQSTGVDAGEDSEASEGEQHVPPLPLPLPSEPTTQTGFFERLNTRVLAVERAQERTVQRPSAGDGTRATTASTTEWLDKLTRQIGRMRSSQSEPSNPLSSACIDDVYHEQLRVLPMVGDGRCQLYSLLCSEDESRRLLRVQLETQYTDAEWAERVPAYTRDTVSRQEFITRYLTDPRSHLPLDSIALWQDQMYSVSGVCYAVYLLHRTAQQRDYSDEIPCRPHTRADSAIILQFSHDGGVGHYELTTCNDVMALALWHEFIRHLHKLHNAHVIKAKRTGEMHRVKRDMVEIE